MDKDNSLVGFYTGFYNALYHDVVGCHASVCRSEYSRDLQEIANRVNSEGMGFFTKTLPRLGKCFDKALGSGDLLQFSSFKRKKGTQLPAFMGWLVSKVFDETGRERSDACAMALRQLRQLCFVFYKLELPYDESTAQKAIENFVSVDEEVGSFQLPTSTDSELILKTARNIVRRLTAGLDPLAIEPRHGPGSVSTGEVLADKRVFKRLSSRLEQVYPFTEYFMFNYTHVVDRLDEIQTLEICPFGTAKVVLVPKDSRGPRIISCEPLENQWIQQGQKGRLVSKLESDPLTRGQINFADQLVNRDLAMAGSRDGSLCTLDMKEASDRVSMELVSYLFPENWMEALDASRSTHTRLPDGTVIALNKFAPMGSATCFPVEAFIFWALSVSIVICRLNTPLRIAAKQVWVYGDDIICHSASQAVIRQYLPKFGLVLNEGKCCTQGFFRESCGCDAYRGVDVTPTKISSVWCQSLDANNYESYVAYSNALYVNGYFGCAEYLELAVQQQRSTPTTSVQTSGITFIRDHIAVHSYPQPERCRKRFNRNLQRLEVKGWISRPSHIVTADDDWEELLRVTSLMPKSESAEDDSRVSYPRRSGPFSVSLLKKRLSSGESLEKILSLPGPTSVRARVYAVPRSNRLIRGWIALR